MPSKEEVITILNAALNQRAKIRKDTDAVYFCPICKHHKRKLEINLISGKYHCWVCGLSGLKLTTLFRKLNVPFEYYSSLHETPTSNPSNYKIENLKNLLSVNINVKEVLHLPTEYQSFDKCKDSIECRNALRYLKTRHITDVDIMRYQIGFADRGEFRGRLLIPSFDAFNNLNFFVGRSYWPNVTMRYNNCRFSKNIIGFESLVDFTQEITIVEGPFDAMSVKYNCVPLFGKTMSMKLKSELIGNKTPIVNVLLDDDARDDSIRIIEFLMRNNISTKLINIGKHDPSVMGFDGTWEAIRSSKVLDFDSFFRLKIKKNYDCNTTYN